MPRRIMEGVVVSTKTDKTAIVRVDRTYLHPLLKKTVRRSKKYHAHDEANAAALGAKIAIRECPPRSKLKRWEVFDPSAPAPAADAKADAKAEKPAKKPAAKKPAAKKKAAAKKEGDDA